MGDQLFTLVMIKSDAISAGLISEIAERIRLKGLIISKQTTVTIDRALIKRIWTGIFRESTLERSYGYIGGHELPVWLLKGPNAVMEILQVKKEIRQLYCTDELHTLIHCPDSEEDFIREFEIFFGFPSSELSE